MDCDYILLRQRNITVRHLGAQLILPKFKSLLHSFLSCFIKVDMLLVNLLRFQFLPVNENKPISFYKVLTIVLGT